MTIYSQISSNKTRTFFIMLIFVFLISGFFLLVGQYFNSPSSYFLIGFIFSLASGFASYFYSDRLVLFTVGAQPADRKRYFNLYTAVENLSIATGLPMPKIYVINDPAPNAFATGRNPKHAIVCATTGLLERLDRAELEGVIAHELSHIKNYDILLASVVAVLVGMLALVADWIMRSFWWGSFGGRDEEKENRNPIFFVLLIVALILTPIVATLIQLAISRRREFLADADGVLITRYPEGLAKALEKIADDPRPLKKVSPATAHLFISDPLKKRGSSWFTSLFNTHPPIQERIKILKEM